MASTAHYKALARKYALHYGLDPRIFVRQINAESGFNPNSYSGAGAKGIAQIMPDTAKSWGVDPMDSAASLRVAAKQMARYVRKYGSYRKALAAYNAGEGAVQQYGGVPPYAETQNYVRKILSGITPMSGRPDASNQKTSGTGQSGSQTSGAADTTQPQISATALTTPTPQISPPTMPDMFDTTKLIGSQVGPGGNAQPVPELPSLPATEPTKTDLTTPASQGGTVVPTDNPLDVSAPTDQAQASLPAGLARIKKRADRIDAEKRTYLYGGGHGAPSKVGDGKPIDCSAAVSLALGIPTRVSGAMDTWGKPGKGKGKNVVNVYYNGGHTFMEINGHFWGTSKTNPGGGAGWIPRSAMNSQYLSGFKVRHVNY